LLKLYEFDEPPFSGKPITEIEAECGVKLGILGEKNKWINAYLIRVSGPDSAVADFLEEYLLRKKSKNANSYFPARLK